MNRNFRQGTTMPDIVRLNDPTTHGGTVTSVAATHFTVAGTPVACMGDKCSCPVHSVGTIIEGDPHHTIDGIPVAYDGHKTSCGATVKSTLANFTRG